MAEIAKTKYTSQYIDNLSFDDQLKVSMVEIIGSDGSVVGERSNRLAINGDYIYEGNAFPGTNESSPLWQISRFQKSTLTTLWADGNTAADNVWSDYLTLSYS